MKYFLGQNRMFQIYIYMVVKFLKGKPEQKIFSKWDKKADVGILIGYSEVGYRVLINGKIIVARHVDIVEENVKCIGLNECESDEELYESSDNESLDDSCKGTDENLGDENKKK